MIDKDIEKHRYDNRANIFLDSNNLYHFDKIPTYLNTPYQYYFHLLKRKSGQSKLLEIGAGMGENTGSLLDMSFKVTSTDISSKSVEVMRNKFSKYSNFSVEVADMEKLPFNNESFDVVCSAGSLSYGDNNVDPRGADRRNDDDVEYQYGKRQNDIADSRQHDIPPTPVIARRQSHHDTDEIG